MLMEFDEIIVEKRSKYSPKHIYGFRNEEAVEIADKDDPMLAAIYAEVQGMCSPEKGWKLQNNSDFEERYTRGD